MMSGPEGTVPKDPQRLERCLPSRVRLSADIRKRCARSFRRCQRTCLAHGWELGMVAITSLAKDDRAARITLATTLEPDDAVTGRLIAAVGAVEAVRLAAGTGAFPKKVDAVEAELWRQKVAPRLNPSTVTRAL